MISLHNIFSIAKYERKTLFRSWFFRIFGALSMLVLFGMNFGVVVQDPMDQNWAVRALPGAIPYFNLLILNVAQAVIAVFLASDFLKRDKKLDTTEVIYMRSMTNGEYVIGKTLGNLQVFLLLNFAVVFMALIFNAMAEGTSINWASYGIYLALISIPTLVFIMGLSFLLMSVVRNQAITFVLILGYIGITLFVLQAKFYYIFDYMAFNIPMVSSEIVGFGNLEVILAHRGIYLGLGLGFIFLTIFLLKRLPQSESMTWFSLIFSIVFIAGAGYLAFNHIQYFTQAEKTRAELIELNDSYVKEPGVSVFSNQLDLEHSGQRISITSIMRIVNENKVSLDKLIFSLNGGLSISDLKFNGKTTPFLRDHHIVVVSDQVNLLPGDTATLEISYAGTIDETYCYLDIDEETRMKKFGQSALNVDKRYAFVEPGYVLLTKEANWYPKAGVTYSSKDVSWHQPQFVQFSLNVKTKPGLQAVSQGEVKEKTAGEFAFETSAALTQLSLAIGPYKYKGIETKNNEFGIWYFDGHDYFNDAFPNLKDTVGAIISERFNDFKRGYNLEYSDPRLTIVEVPAQFKSYPRGWTSVQEAVQPQQVFIQEKGYLIPEADFAKRKGMEGRGGWGHQNTDMTDEEKETRVLQSFLRKFTTETEGNRGFGPPQPGNNETVYNPYFIFPMLYNFQNNIQSDRWPITNRVFEAYLKSQTFDMRSFFRNSMAGESKEVLANIALQDHTFEQILADPEQQDIVNDVIKLKGDVLFSTIQWKVGQKEFQDFLHQTLVESRHKNMKFEDFDQKLNDEFGIEIVPIMDTWFKAKKLPGYLIAPVKAVKVKSGDAMKTMIGTKITNFSEVEGLVKLSFRLGGGGGFGPRGGGNQDMIDNLVFLEANQTKEVSYLINGEPRAVIVNTMTSKNIPQSFIEGFREIEEDPKAKPVEGERITDVPVQIKQPNETVVDNEDPEFEVTSNHHVSLLERLIVKEDKKTRRYQGIDWWRPATSWTAVTNSDFYGEYVRSAYYIKGGDGDQIAKWHVPVKKKGYYDVYFHLYKNNWGRRGRGEQKGNYDFTIHADDGAEEAALETQNAETGWVLLGTYYFSGDTALIELSNKTELNMMFADAIKIVEQ